MAGEERYRAYVEEQRRLALVAVWPSCASCDAGPSRPCRPTCPELPAAAREPEAPEGAVLTRADYEKWRRHDYAGTVGSDHRWAAFWRDHFPWWDGKYWLMSGTNGGVSLGPINVRD